MLTYILESGSRPAGAVTSCWESTTMSQVLKELGGRNIPGVVVECREGKVFDLLTGMIGQTVASRGSFRVRTFILAGPERPDSCAASCLLISDLVRFIIAAEDDENV